MTVPTDRTTIAELCQIGVETTPGTRVPATKRLAVLKFEPSVNLSSIPYIAMGYKYTNIEAPSKEWTEIKVSGPLTYYEVLYPLYGAFQYAAPQANYGAVTGRYRWTVDSNLNEADGNKTFSLEFGSYLIASSVANARTTDFNISVDRNKADVDGKAIGTLYHTSLDGGTTPFTLTGTNDVQIIHASIPPTEGSYKIVIPDIGNINGGTTAAIAWNATAATTATRIKDALTTANTGLLFTITGAGGALSDGTNVTLTFGGVLSGRNVPDITFTDLSTLKGAGSVAVTLSHPGSGETNGAPLTSVKLVPVLPKDFYLFMTTADYDAAFFPTDYTDTTLTKMSRSFSYNFKCSKIAGPVFPLDKDQESYAITVEEVGRTTEVTIKIEADSVGMAFIQDCRDAKRTYARLLAKSDLWIPGTTSGAKYRFCLDAALQISKIGPFADQEGVYAYEITATVMSDNDWGHAFLISVDNSLAAI